MPDFNRRDTAGNICKAVLSVLGLPVPQVVSQATDSTSKQIWALLTECGQDLLDKHEWQFFNRTHQFNTIPGTLIYDLPSDFQNYIDSTGWNNTARIPLIGPLTDQQWRLLQARQLGGTTLRMQYVIAADKVEFYFVPDTPQTIAIEYKGRGWVRNGTNPLIFRDYIETDSDLVLYDRRLMITYLKYRWREVKGFDSTNDREAYEDALDNAKYNDKPKVDLRISGAAGYPYLGYLNMPDTGYGGS